MSQFEKQHLDLKPEYYIIAAGTKSTVRSIKTISRLFGFHHQHMFSGLIMLGFVSKPQANAAYLFLKNVFPAIKLRVVHCAFNQCQANPKTCKSILRDRSGSTVALSPSQDVMSSYVKLPLSGFDTISHQESNDLSEIEPQTINDALVSCLMIPQQYRKWVKNVSNSRLAMLIKAVAKKLRHLKPNRDILGIGTDIHENLKMDQLAEKPVIKLLLSQRGYVKLQKMAKKLSENTMVLRGLAFSFEIVEVRKRMGPSVRK